MTYDELMAAVDKHGSQRKAAEALGIPRSTLGDRLRLKNDDARGNNGGRFLLGDGRAIGKVTTHVDQNGVIKNEWIRHNWGEEERMLALEAIAESLKKQIPRVAALPAPTFDTNLLLSTYIVSDLHLGLKAWAEETRGEDWDIEKAEQLFDGFCSYATQRAPATKEALLVVLGDQFHWDGILPVTPTSRHIVDADTRFAKLIDVGISSIRRAIDVLLMKHPLVKVIWVTGNHDITSSMWMRKMLAIAYENEPRITIDTIPSLYHCHQFGKTCLFFHHGHKRKMTNVAETFVSSFKKEYGSAEYHYGHLGHLHHRELRVKESGLMELEQHQTLAPSDAHGAEGGYNSKRAANVIVYSKEHGEIDRFRVTPELIKLCYG